MAAPAPVNNVEGYLKFRAAQLGKGNVCDFVEPKRLVDSIGKPCGSQPHEERRRFREYINKLAGAQKSRRELPNIHSLEITLALEEHRVEIDALWHRIKVLINGCETVAEVDELRALAGIPA